MPAGRPTVYREELNKKVKKLARLGAIDKELADFLDIAESTLNEWKLKYPEFSESIRAGKLESDYNVANSLYKRAMGYSHADTDIRVCDGLIVETPITKHYPPDTTAAIFWLKNRRPDQWRDKADFEVNGKIEGLTMIVKPENK